MKSILLLCMLMLSTVTFSQKTKPLQITIRGISDSTRCDFKDSSYYLKDKSIYVDATPGIDDLFIYSEFGLLLYELHITDKTSLIVITIE